MDVSSFPEKLDELAEKYITKLVLIYDRGYMPPQYSTRLWSDFFLSTEEMPLYVFVYSIEGLLAKYNFDLPYKSNKTWTISITAHANTLDAILRKALTPNGPKTYLFHNVAVRVYKHDLDLAHFVYRDISISCQLNMEAPMVDGYKVKLGKNGEYLFNAGLRTGSRFRCIGNDKSYLDRMKVKLLGIKTLGKLR